MIISQADVTWFWARVLKTACCWEWRGAVKDHSNPYGRTRTQGGAVYLAHRVAYFIATGIDPAGLHVLHRCDNPRCVRPEHLFLGTPKENMDDCQRKGRLHRLRGEKWHQAHDGKHGGHKIPAHLVRRGEALPWAKLTEQDVREIRATWGGARKKYGVRKALAEKYAVDKTLIWQVVTNRIWSHVA